MNTEHLILSQLGKLSSPVYESKLAGRLGFSLPNAELNALISKGHIDRDDSLRVKITSQGGSRLKQLDDEFAASLVVPPTADEKRLKVLCEKARDGSIADAETIEGAKLILKGVGMA